MSDIHALSGAYAVDALDDLERAQFERHLAECAACRTEVDSFRGASGLLAETTAAEPPAALRSRLLADIRTVRPLPPVTPAPETAGNVTRLRPRPHLLRALVAAAVVVAAVAAGAVWHPWTDETSQGPNLSAAERVQGAPDAVKVTRRLQAGGAATIWASKSLNRFVVSTRDLPPLAEGKVYEMWLQDRREGMVPVRGGLMSAADSTVVLEGDVADAVGAGITIEPAGGSRVPTSEPVALFEFEKA
jgi:anti-sigma-K factor RskA